MTRRSTTPRKPALLTFTAALSALALGACGGAGSHPGGTATTPSSPQSPTTRSAPPTGAGTGTGAPGDPLERVIPEPAEVTAGTGTFTLGKATTIGADPGARAVADDLAAYLKQQTGVAPAVKTTGNVQLTLHAPGTDPKLGGEGYRLDVDPASVRVTADSAAGLFHGVQTIRQLITGAAPAVIPAGHITDFPRFAYRGVMLDVARHFFSVGDVEKYIDAVSLYKVNELHLHLTDDQGWRFAVPEWPNLAAYGGQTEVGGGAGGYYTAQDYKTIVAYAESRFMNVVPEIDMPGHVGAATASYPELACDGKTHGLVTSISPAFNALCTTGASTYTFVDNSIAAIAAMTPGPFLHIGGDEASALTQAQYDGFVTRSQLSAAAQGKAPIAWAEIASGPVAPGTVAEFWDTGHSEPYVAAAAAHGTKLILAPASHAYLDQQPVAGFPLGLRWAGLVPLSRAYAWDPGTLLAGVRESSVLGVEAPLFTETVHSLSDAEILTFPHLPAVAEAGWSPQRTHAWAGFAARVGAQGPLWTKLGISYYKSPEVPWQ